MDEEDWTNEMREEAKQNTRRFWENKRKQNALNSHSGTDRSESDNSELINKLISAADFVTSLRNSNHLRRDSSVDKINGPIHLAISALQNTSTQSGSDESSQCSSNRELQDRIYKFNGTSVDEFPDASHMIAQGKALLTECLTHLQSGSDGERKHFDWRVNYLLIALEALVNDVKEDAPNLCDYDSYGAAVYTLESVTESLGEKP